MSIVTCIDYNLLGSNTNNINIRQWCCSRFAGIL